MHLVPRYRQKLAHVPFGQGRPVWVDDPHFNVRYHVRHSALPAPGLRRAAAQPRRAAVRPAAGPHQAAVGAQPRRGPRGRPLRDHLEDPPRARRRRQRRRHHLGALRRLARRRRRRRPTAASGCPRPEPTDAELLAQALLERATVPAEGARGLRALTRAPRQALGQAGEWLVGVGAMAWAGLNPAPPSPFNVPIGPHRRYTWVDSEVARFKAIKNALGGTLNDVVLSAVSLALGRFLRRRGVETDGLVLKAMVPVSVRADDAARRAGQPCRGHVGAAARGRDRSRGGARPRSPRRCAGSRSPARPSAPWR